MKSRWFLAVAMLLAGLVPAASAQTGPQLARSIVRSDNYVSLQPVPRGRVFEIAVVANIQQAYHINAHKVLEEYLIPTEIEAKSPIGFHLLSTEYPAGELRQFSFSKNKLAVYTGRVVLRLRFLAERNAPLGTHELPLTLRYQACNNTMCLPPVEVPVSVDVTVAKAGSPARRVHREIFENRK
jgi:hypothetical protein